MMSIEWAKPVATGLWLLVSLDSCLYCEDFIKPNIIYSALIRPKIRPKHASALNKCHVKTHFSLSMIIFVGQLLYYWLWCTKRQKGVGFSSPEALIAPFSYKHVGCMHVCVGGLKVGSSSVTI